MSVEVACQCGQRFRAPSHLYGTRQACIACGCTLIVPQPPQEQVVAHRVEIACGCGQSFAAGPSLQGGRVACPNCGAPLDVPTTASTGLAPTADPFDDALEDIPLGNAYSPSLPRQTLPRSQDSVNWPLIATIGGIVVAVALLVVGGIVVVGLFPAAQPSGDLSEDRLAGGTSGESSETMDPSAEKSRYGHFELSIPDDFRLHDSRRSPDDETYYFVWGNSTVLGRHKDNLMLDVRRPTTDQKTLDQLKAQLVQASSQPGQGQNQQYNRDSVNGVACLRMSADGRVPGGGSLHHLSYFFLDGGFLFTASLTSTEPPGSDAYQKMEAAVRSVQRHDGVPVFVEPDSSQWRR